MKKVLIVYCHPYEKSFNHAVLDAVQSNLQQHQQDYTVIDLYKDEFAPFYTAKELSLFHEGKTVDPLVTKYLALLKSSSTVIFITPIWWNSIPGMLKGWVDKVMKEGPELSHTVSKLGVKGELTNIKHCYVLTTSTSPTFYIKYLNGNGIKRIFINHTLKQLGFNQIRWENFGMISDSTLPSRQNYLKKIEKQVFD